MSKIENLKWELRSFIPEDCKVLKEKFDELMTELKEVNKNNWKAHIPTTRIETKEIYFGDYRAFDDYEILTGVRIDSEGNSFSTEEEYKNHLIKEAKNKYKIVPVWVYDGITYRTQEEAQKTAGEMDAQIEPFEIVKKWCVVDTDDDFIDDENLETYEKANSYLEKCRNSWVEEQEEWEDLEFEADEIYWNYAWRFNRLDVDTELANELGLVAIHFTSGEHEGESFITLGGCGMDLSPKIVAFKALTFGYIDEYDVYKLERNRDYFIHVVGKSIYAKMLKKLGIFEMLMKEDGLEEYANEQD